MILVSLMYFKITEQLFNLKTKPFCLSFLADLIKPVPKKHLSQYWKKHVFATGSF